ncbi:MAG: cupredoxin domain-containing protein [Acidimicrobiia bacterium]
MFISKRIPIALVAMVVAVLACGGEGDTATGSPSTTAAATETTAATVTTASPTGPTLTIDGRSFGLAPEVAAGDSFTIVNLDSTRHTFSSSDGAWEQVDLAVESQTPFTVPDDLVPGRYVFFCAIHSDMSGSLTVSG